MRCNFIELFVITVFLQLIIIIEESKQVKIDRKCIPSLSSFCIEIRKCPFFVDLLTKTSIPRPRHIIKVIRDYHCGFESNTPKVCCFPNLKQVQNVELEKIINNSYISYHKNINALPLSMCGTITNEFRITSGSKTIPLEFPWMVLIAYNASEGIDFKCGGTLIHAKYVLTAAHCVQNLTLISVRLGEHNIQTTQDCNFIKGICAPPVQDISIDKVIIHPDYVANSYENDIALIRLVSSANFSYDNIKPICLPIGDAAKVNLNKKIVIVSGWGITENGLKSIELLKTFIPVISNEDCKNIYEGHSKINSNQICAGGFMGRDSCGGDSGGPLKFVGRINYTARYIQYGIVSYGPKYCGTAGQPGVYTRVTHYMYWILDNLNLN